ncbi:MAG TPA: protein kinase [Candidatus Sulfotelmatobacter sp.]|jgi:serine/threonine protein kinase/Tol biopolymer transport system component
MLERMALTSGTKLGPYEIQSPLGAGGMGEVYRAKDSRLDRTVAIKVLNSKLAANTELRARFEREAKIISQLQHAHICVLHDVGHHEGADFLVMEFLEGESLADRLKKGRLAMEQLLKIATEIADALEKAHRAGVVHRDLKPGNVMLTKSGAKLLDFGLAKPLGATVATSDGSGSSASVVAAALTQTIPTPSPVSPLSAAGTVIGTVQYMSPEQIQGNEADARSDIFAFGLMVFEMAAGKRAFEGKTQASIVGQILAFDPPAVTTLRPDMPLALDQLIRNCLEKDPDERIQTAHDLKLSLQGIAVEQAGRKAAAAVALPSGHRRERLIWSAAVVAAIVLGAVAAMWLYHPSQTAPPIRAAINPPANATLSLIGDFAGPPVLSPDGSSLAFVAVGADGNNAIWVRPLNAPEAHVLAGTDTATFPFWSWDSRSLGFFAEDKLKTINVNSGSTFTVCDARFGRGGSWGPGGIILFSPQTPAPIMRVSSSGGTAVAVTKNDAPSVSSHRWPFILPDGKHFLYLAININDPASDAVHYASVDGSADRLLFQSRSNAVYSNGFLLFVRSGQLMAQPFDPANGTLSGEAQSLASSVIEDLSTWHIDVSASTNGLLIFGSGGTGDEQLVWVDRNGKQIGTVAGKMANVTAAKLSPQGDRIALEIDNGIGAHDIWVLDVVRGVQTRLTFGPIQNSNPVWSPDGKWIAYSSIEKNNDTKLYRKPSDGSGAAELLHSDDHDQVGSDWSQDGKYLIYARGHVGILDYEIWALPLQGDHKPWLVVPRAEKSIAYEARLSPDGRWLAYTSKESGNLEVYVVAFHGGEGKWQVSTNGGTAPQWSRDGKELYYAHQANRSIMAVPVKEANEGLQFGAAQSIASDAKSSTPGVYDVAPDGQKILLDLVAQQVSPSVTVMTNFTAALKK